MMSPAIYFTTEPRDCDCNAGRHALWPDPSVHRGGCPARCRATRTEDGGPNLIIGTAGSHGRRVTITVQCEGGHGHEMPHAAHGVGGTTVVWHG